MSKKIDKAKVVRAVISELESEQAPDKIKVNGLKGYDNPERIKLNKEEEGVVPDLTVHQGNEINIYELELEESFDAEKWRLMSLYTKKENGHLFLVVPDFLREKVKSELQNKGLNAGLIYFNT